MANAPEPPVPAGRWLAPRDFDRYYYAGPSAEVHAWRDPAVARAEALLRDHLDPRQAADYARVGAFVVRGGGGNKYMIHRDGRVFGNGLYLCIGSVDGYLPRADVVLGLKLLIEADEEGFLLTANLRGHPLWKLKTTGDVDFGGVLVPHAEVSALFEPVRRV